MKRFLKTLPAFAPLGWRVNGSHCLRAVLPSVFAVFAVGWQADAFTIVPTFDVTITSDPQAATIEATINSAIAVYEADFSDPVTAYITFYQSTTGLGGSTTFGENFAYTDYLAALVSHATTADDATALAHLPNTTGNPVNGNSDVWIRLVLARALGLTSDVGTPDSSISINMSACNLSSAQHDPTKYSLFAVVSHEIDEAIGFGSELNGVDNGTPPPTGPVEAEDLFRYTTSGARSWTTAANAAAYCSFDGVTDIARFNQNQNGDFADWYSPGGQTPQVQDAFGTPGSTPVLGVELRVLDAIGFTRNPSPVWVDFNYSGPQDGTYLNPYSTLAQGVTAVPTGRTIVINSTVQPSTSSETMTITKAMLITSVNGPATIGH